MKSYIAIGSNLGDKHKHVNEAVRLIHELPNTNVLRVSNWHETEPVGLPDGAEQFVNGVAEIETDLSPQELMTSLLEIEKILGRIRNHNGYESRTIDLDLLLYGDQTVDTPNVKVPHPRMTERLFVMKPLSELCPEFVIPGFEKSVSKILHELETDQPNQ
jgi:2-amino-4-hydroxy-6-hydroxymethyldihydropteridine diphosphokinase